VKRQVAETTKDCCFSKIAGLYCSPMVATVLEFGEFTLDCGRFELCRAGRPIALERKPMELLILLAASNGQLLTRTEIAERLWERAVFVDTEHGINTAIRKIRQASVTIRKTPATC
jgi:DNA-binding response OmpR family regulator